MPEEAAESIGSAASFCRKMAATGSRTERKPVFSIKILQTGM